MTSSPSGWGECGRHARERRAHAPARGPPAAGRRSEVAGPGRAPRRAARGRVAAADSDRPFACASVVLRGRQSRILGGAHGADAAWAPGRWAAQQPNCCCRCSSRGTETAGGVAKVGAERGADSEKVVGAFRNGKRTPAPTSHFRRVPLATQGFLSGPGWGGTGQCWNIAVDFGGAALGNLKVKLGHVGSAQPSLLGGRILLGKSLGKT